jgi:CheY-like chemotaxis protein
MISIVDDDSFIRQATDSLVRSLGYRIATFASAEDFLQSRYIHETTCLISDVQMPGLSGVDLQQVLIAQGHRIPMIFITAYFDERIRQSVMEAGAIGYLSKPFDDESLIELLQSTFGNLAIEARLLAHSAICCDASRFMRHQAASAVPPSFPVSHGPAPFEGPGRALFGSLVDGPLDSNNRDRRDCAYLDHGSDHFLRSARSLQRRSVAVRRRRSSSKWHGVANAVEGRLP